MTDWHEGMRTADGGPIVGFYEKVLILDSAEAPEIRGKYGWILGVSEEDGIVSGYHVTFDEFDHGYGVRPADVLGTGERAPREKFYSGESIRVSRRGRLLG